MKPVRTCFSIGIHIVSPLYHHYVPFISSKHGCSFHHIRQLIIPSWKLWDFFIIRPHTILKTIFGISLGASSANWFVVLNEFLLAKIGTKKHPFPVICHNILNNYINYMILYVLSFGNPAISHCSYKLVYTST